MPGIIESNRLKSVRQLDPTDKYTLRAVVTLMLNAGYDAAAMSEAVGPSRRTIQGWRDGLNIPISGDYRKFIVEQFLNLIEQNQPGEPKISGPKERTGATI